MKKRIAGGLLLGLLWGPAPVPAEILYRVTELGTLRGYGSFGYGINNAGQVTGNDGWLDVHAFLYSNGQMTDLGTLGGSGSSGGYGINDAGQVVGGSDTSTDARHAFLYTDGQMTD